jgi:hypothetical protein
VLTEQVPELSVQLPADAPLRSATHDVAPDVAGRISEMSA